MSVIAFDLLSEAQRYGVRLRPTPCGIIKVSAPTAPPADLIAKLKAHRTELLEALSATDWDQASKDERTALMEHEGGIPRAWADGFARLCTMSRPPGFTVLQWHQIIDDSGKFMDRWAARVANLGWSTEEVFGVGPSAPDARHDLKGLVPLIDGDEVVAVGPSTVTLRARSGSELKIYRVRSADSRIALWDLMR